jgi:hypothetical protein
MGAPADADGLSALAAALAAYLAELDGYRAVCLRRGRSASIWDGGDGLRVRQEFGAADAVAETLRAAVLRLPGWDETAWWPAGRERWAGLMRRTKAEAASAGGRRVALRGVAWDGRPALVSAGVPPGAAWLCVELVLPPLPADLPELPLRRVARALGCHEFLVPPSVALPPQASPGGGALTVREYLKRAMPNNLAVSQCIFGGGAE